MNDDDSDLFSWATDDEDTNHQLTSQSVAIRDATPRSQIRHGRSRLPLLQLAEWDETLAYDEQPPTCVHFLIEWKVKLNNRCVSKDTEPDVVLTPGAYCSKYLWSKVDKLAKKKLPANRTFHVDDTVGRGFGRAIASHIGSNPADRAGPAVSGTGDHSILVAGEDHVVDQGMLTSSQIRGHADVAGGVE